jgi:parvulin-like peptidyl-prolyl isomerase
MYRINTIIFYSLLFSLLTALPLQGSWLPWSSPTLVSIAGEDYNNEDFKNWWEHWQEEDMELPKTVVPFVDWFLLFKEAERMKLYESPEYRKKVLTFLKARTLMQLKGEEIDSKINIDDDALWKQYLETHAPQYHLNIFFFKDQETAQAFVEKFRQAPVSNEDFSTSHGRGDGYFSQRTEWYRPLAINPGWLPVLGELEKENISSPIPWKGDFVVLRLQDKVEGSRRDYERVKKQLRETVWKKEENRLTVDLLTRLRQQYHVKIDTERLKQLDPEAPDDMLSDEAIIFTDNGNISEKIIVAKIRQILRFRRQNGFQVETTFQFKNQIVNGIIDQTLTSWEGLARNYQQKPPFEAVYEFYCQNRMIKILEGRLFGPQSKVADEAILEYYQQNLTLFTQPEIIRMAIVEGSEKALNALWLEVALGGDFQILAQQRTGETVPIRDIPANHLNPKVKEVVNKLTKNEVSQVFTVDGHVSLVQLIERKAAQTMALSEVKETIRKSLHTAKLDKLRQDYLDKLREEYAVVTNDAVWQNLKKELEQLDETN